jgi:hypothetical protein
LQTQSVGNGVRSVVPVLPYPTNWFVLIPPLGMGSRVDEGEGETGMRQVIRGAQGLALQVALLLGLLVAPQLASATPVTYYFQNGSVTVSVSTGPTTLLVVPGQPLDGNYLTFDDAVPELTDINLQVNAAGPFTLSQSYDGYDTVSVANVVLSPAAGYSGPATLQLAGPPVDNYSYSGGPVKVTGILSATDSTNVNPPLVSPFNILNPVANGTLLVNSVTGNISLLGVTIGVVPPQGAEPFPLVIKGDFFFRGVIPEPATALLLGSGMVALLAAGRRLRS